MTMDQGVIANLRRQLTELYADRAETCLSRLLKLVERYAPSLTSGAHAGWDQRDIVLITYGDQVSAAGESPLSTLQTFLASTGLDRLLNTIHLLPFFPYSSDDGFSVIDYRRVDPALGDWEDVGRLGGKFGLMFDLVLNHVSRHSDWFEKYLEGREPFARYFIEVDPDTDLSRVTRPRSLPVLTRFETSRGPRHVWTTFGPDQIDLNYGEPDVLLAMVDVLLFYVGQGAQIIRLDAIAYLWKRIGTSCIHLSETHTVVKLLRELLDAVAPHVVILTETNVPAAENVSYFGDGDEARMVYQFSLPPLLLDAFLNRDARPLSRWLEDLPATPTGTTYFNFTASHDGVGVRPLEGIVPKERIAQLVEHVKSRGGIISTKRDTSGADTPYELNISYFDALGEPDSIDPQLHVRRFLASQAIMLALRGIPGIYFHSLFGTPNDHQAAADSGEARKINRRKFTLDEIEARLSDTDSPPAQVLQGYRHLLRVRINQPAFHPDAQQRAWHWDVAQTVGFERISLDGRQRILVLANVDDRPQRVDLTGCVDPRYSRDLLRDEKIPSHDYVDLAPYQVAWLEAERL